MKIQLVGRFVQVGNWLAVGLLLCAGMALAEADGPDFFRVRGAVDGKPVSLRAEPAASARVIGNIPASADCLRNQGCVGGLTLDQSSTLPAEARARAVAANPRWCKVASGKVSGWLEGHRLAESGCTAAPLPDQRIVYVDPAAAGAGLVLEGSIRGRDFIDYALVVGAGQQLVVSLSASHSQTYFNILPPTGEAALFVGSLSGANFSRQLPQAGRYTARVYLMRAAARRQVQGQYRLSLQLSGVPLQPLASTTDAVLPGTAYHASSTLPCRVGDTRSCDAFVTRWAHAGTATVAIRWPDDMWALGQHLLFVRGNPVATDGSTPFTFRRQGDWTRIEYGAEASIDIPDALIFGG